MAVVIENVTSEIVPPTTDGASAERRPEPSTASEDIQKTAEALERLKRRQERLRAD